MTQIWEEVALRGGNCSWLEILRCREMYSGNVDNAVTTLLHMQRSNKGYSTILLYFRLS